MYGKLETPSTSGEGERKFTESSSKVTGMRRLNLTQQNTKIQKDTKKRKPKLPGDGTLFGHSQLFAGSFGTCYPERGRITPNSELFHAHGGYAPPHAQYR